MNDLTRRPTTSDHRARLGRDEAARRLAEARSSRPLATRRDVHLCAWLTLLLGAALATVFVLGLDQAWRYVACLAVIALVSWLMRRLPRAVPRGAATITSAATVLTVLATIPARRALRAEGYDVHQSGPLWVRGAVWAIDLVPALAGALLILRRGGRA